MTTPTSPITQSNRVALEREISVQTLVEGYQRKLQIDVRRFFVGMSSVRVYRCLDTGYRFYYPFETAGDGAFYEALQGFDWYYQDWKWENEQALRWINPQDRVLEIGAGKGAFLSKLKQKNIAAVGLELNQAQVQLAQKQGLDLRAELIQTHAAAHPESYDLVCSFQVMEHIAEVREVWEASVHALRKGGRLLVGVPNNSAFFRDAADDFLNMPPHHIGLWDEDSLAKVAPLFGLKLLSLDCEPLRAEHQLWYRRWRESAFLTSDFKRRWFYRLRLHRLHEWQIRRKAHQIKGHSVLAVYEKI